MVQRVASSPQRVASSPQKERMDMVKQVLAEATREKTELVQRLNLINKLIEEEEDLTTKVRLKVEWMEEKDRSVELLNKMVSSLQGLLQEDGSAASPTVSDTEDPSAAAPPPHPWAFSAAMRARRASSMFSMKMLVRECSAEPAAHLPITWSETAAAPVSRAASVSVSRTASLLFSEKKQRSEARCRSAPNVLSPFTRSLRRVSIKVLEGVDLLRRPSRGTLDSARSNWDYGE
ncbi:hypothetical protein T484DRAFT_1942316 [Baffinella frigidus]|nr:hypothetical protein T484DRAFT_1942316 [Cryptophyta sp. CCMP2293]